MNVCTHDPPGTLTLPTLSQKPCAHRVGTSSSWISILLPLKSECSNRQILCSMLSCNEEPVGQQVNHLFESTLSLQVAASYSSRSGWFPVFQNPIWVLVLLGRTHHADGPEGHEAVAAVGVAPGVPARILSLLQDEHLPTEVSLLKGNKAAGGMAGERGGVRRGTVAMETGAEAEPVSSTYGPHSTIRLRTRSMPRSHTFMHSFCTSIILPWKFSWSNSMICRQEAERAPRLRLGGPLKHVLSSDGAVCLRKLPSTG